MPPLDEDASLGEPRALWKPPPSKATLKIWNFSPSTAPEHAPPPSMRTAKKVLRRSCQSAVLRPMSFRAPVLSLPSAMIFVNCAHHSQSGSSESTDQARRRPTSIGAGLSRDSPQAPQSSGSAAVLAQARTGSAARAEKRSGFTINDADPKLTSDWPALAP